MKVATIVGTRPEIIRLSRVLAKLDKAVDHTLIHTGQNYDYELNEIFFEQLELRRPGYFLEAVGSTAAETIAQIISKSDAILRELRPDAVLILGDTNSCLAAISAKRLKIPIFHMEAGNRCFDQRVPEEINRKIVDHISDINLPYSSISREYLLREGIPPDRVIKTGSPMNEVLSYFLPRIQQSDSVNTLGLRCREYYLISCHREENVDFPERLALFGNCLNRLASEFGLPVIVSTHPRTKKRIDDAGITLDPRVKLLKPFGLFDYVNLQMNAKAVLSDSGTISEESSILNFPALNIRDAHERPEAMEEASVPMVGLDWETIQIGLSLLKDQPRGIERGFQTVQDYSALNVSDKVVRLILSYTPYVNRTVWRKPN
jgi:UDP-N-acetylglucosamine 2-epimerase